MTCSHLQLENDHCNLLERIDDMSRTKFGELKRVLLKEAKEKSHSRVKCPNPSLARIMSEIALPDGTQINPCVLCLMLAHGDTNPIFRPQAAHTEMLGMIYHNRPLTNESVANLVTPTF